MEDRNTQRSTNSRRNFLYQMSLVSLFSVTGCSTVAKLVLQYPEKYDTDNDFIQHTLQAFALTVIPGAPQDDPNLIKAFSDTYYPFHKIRGYFVHTLTQMTQERYNIDRFYALNPEQRKEIINRGLRGIGKKRQLFKASIALVQISFYAGIYDSQNGCPMIDFHGQNYGHRPDDMYYQNGSKYLASELTQTGNYT